MIRPHHYHRNYGSPIRGEGVGTEESTSWRLSQYCASLILGAGLLTLPAEATRVGLLPLLGVLLPVWAASRNCYLRLSRVLGETPDTRDCR